ncbi:hypothetical protein [Bacillus atrophaeus]|uniref:hypothetical protein n=1 Tax=Bacillus atrophaeus TaxID=1452 RepID=UPI002E2161F9|nr:hypothetical protein [Bacillus atrophaeus]
MIDAATLLLVAALFSSIVTTYIGLRGKKEEELQSHVKEQAYQLFLYAEKQSWIGPEKMDWVAENIAKRIPTDTLKKFVGEDQIKDWLQSLYNGFKDSLAG